MNTRLRIRIDEGFSIKQLFSKLKVKTSSSPDVIRVLMYFAKNPNLLVALRKTLGEAITVHIEIGDTVLGGKFKNRRIEVKDIGKNEKGDITINGKPLMKYRLIPQED